MVSKVERIPKKIIGEKGIKPCPFCGSENLLLMEYDNIIEVDGTHAFKIFCQLCGCQQTPRHYDEIVESWNQRV